MSLVQKDPGKVKKMGFIFSLSLPHFSFHFPITSLLRFLPSPCFSCTLTHNQPHESRADTDGRGTHTHTRVHVKECRRFLDMIRNKESEVRDKSMQERRGARASDDRENERAQLDERKCETNTHTHVL